MIFRTFNALISFISFSFAPPSPITIKLKLFPKALATLGKITEDNYNKTRKDGKSYHREERVNLGNPGGDPTLGTTTVDLINALDVFKSDQDFQSNAVRDLIRFRIEAVNPYTPNKSDVMVFRAFLDDFGDNYSGTWNSFKYNGRADQAFKYGTFSRDVSFAFSVYPTTKVELEPLYKKLERLSTMTMPKYGTAGYQGMLIRFTLGKMWNQHLALIDSLAYSYSDEVPWDIEAGASMGVDVSIGLKILSDTLPEYETYPVYDLGFGG